MFLNKVIRCFFIVKFILILLFGVEVRMVESVIDCFWEGVGGDIG